MNRDLLMAACAIAALLLLSCQPTPKVSAQEESKYLGVYVGKLGRVTDTVYVFDDPEQNVRCYASQGYNRNAISCVPKKGLR